VPARSRCAIECMRQQLLPSAPTQPSPPPRPAPSLPSPHARTARGGPARTRCSSAARGTRCRSSAPAVRPDLTGSVGPTNPTSPTHQALPVWARLAARAIGTLARAQGLLLGGSFEPGRQSTPAPRVSESRHRRTPFDVDAVTPAAAAQSAIGSGRSACPAGSARLGRAGDPAGSHCAPACAAPQQGRCTWAGGGGRTEARGSTRSRPRAACGPGGQPPPAPPQPRRVRARAQLQPPPPRDGS
jgi:hypothetical protein